MLSVTERTSLSHFGTSDLLNSTYPEPSCGPAITNPYFLSYPKMKPLSPLPVRAHGIRFIDQTWYPVFVPEHDYYPERFALSPDLEEAPKPKKRRGRPRKSEMEHRKKELKQAKEGIVVDGSDTLVPEQEERQESSPIEVNEGDSNTSDCIVVEVPEGRKGNVKLKHARDSAEPETKTEEQRSVKRLRKEKMAGEQIEIWQKTRGRSTRKALSTRPVRATRLRVNYSEN
jgi:hypothetical protein